METSVKRKVYVLLDSGEGGTRWDKIINSFMIVLIILNAFAVILETVDSIYIPNRSLFRTFEIVSVILFSVEFLLRLWSITSVPKYQHPVSGRLKYLLTFGAIVDVLSILPFYLPLLLAVDLRVLRLLRLLRFARFFKLGRYMKAAQLIRTVFRSKKEELLLAFIMTMLLIIIAASLMYFTEYRAQPDKFSSIPETMWWAVATLTTVGYGDVYPVTMLGKILGACISIMGIGLFAFPAGILASGFSDAIKKTRQGVGVCPHCGRELL